MRTSAEAYGVDQPAAGVPDLVVTFAEGYGGTWDTTLGGAAPQVIAPNEERWRADHAAQDERRVPGVWLSSLPPASDTIGVADIAPIVVEYFGRPAPAGDAQPRDKASSASRR